LFSEEEEEENCLPNGYQEHLYRKGIKIVESSIDIDVTPPLSV
jgi:hypothetical protein